MSLPDQIGVYGGRRMGAGIAHAFLLAGAEVTIIEPDEAAVVAAVDRVCDSLTTAAGRGALFEPPAEVATRLRVVTDPAATKCAAVRSVCPSTPQGGLLIADDVGKAVWPDSGLIAHPFPRLRGDGELG